MLRSNAATSLRLSLTALEIKKLIEHSALLMG